MLICALALSVGASVAQSLPAVQLKNLAGETISTGDLATVGQPTLICFWATWCSPCKRELNNYAELYEDWQDETGVNIVAVSIDDQRSIRRVAPYVNSVLWDYDVLLDPTRILPAPCKWSTCRTPFWSMAKEKSSGNTTITLTATKKRCTRNC